MTVATIKKTHSRKLASLAACLTAAMLLSTPAPALASTEESNEFYQDALEWQRKGNDRAAIIQLRNALQQDSENHAARLLLGRLHLQTGNIAGAEKELEYVHRAQPSDESEVLLGRAQLALRKYQSVIAVVRATSDDPAYAAEKAIIRAEALLATGQTDEAATLAEPLLSDPDRAIQANLLMAQIRARQGNREAARGHIDTVLLANPNMIQPYVLQAQLALMERDIDQVLAIADKIQAIDPKDRRGKIMKAEALIRKNALPEAHAELESYLTDTPADYAAVFLNARVLMLMGEHAQADQELQKLPDTVKRQPSVSLVIGLVKYELEQYGQAEEALERYTAVAGERGRQASRLLATIRLRTDRPKAALEALEPLTQGNSGDVASFQMKASAALRTGDLDIAAASLRRVAQIGSPDDQRQAQVFLRVMQTGKRNEAGKLELEPTTLEVLRALDLAQFGNSEAALEKALELQAQQPDNPSVANLLSRLYVARGELEKARAALEPVLAADPGQLASITNMNRIDVAEGNFEAVEKRLRDAVAADPDNQPLILLLAQFIGNRGDRAGAIALLEEKAAELPDSLAIRNNLINVSLDAKKFDAARRWTDEVAAIGARTNPNALIIAGDAYVVLKDFNAAIDVYRQFIEKTPNAAGAMLKMAQAQFQANDTAGAKGTLQQVLSIDPDNIPANRSLISLTLNDRDDAGAMAIADQAATANPAVGAVLRAFVLRSTNRTDEAVTVLQDQLSQSPSAGLLRETYGMMLAADRRDEAATLLTSWLGDNPDDAGVLQLLGSQYIQDGDYPKALVAMERAFSLLPNNVVILNNLSWLRYEMKRPGAKELARRAYRMAPNAAAVADTLGWILVRDGEFGEGLKLLRAAADSAPKNGDIAYHVAYALHQTGDSDGAKAILERLMAEEFEPQNFTERDHAAELLAKLKQG